MAEDDTPKEFEPQWTNCDSEHTIPEEFGPRLPPYGLESKLQEMEWEFNKRLSIIEQRLSDIEGPGPVRKEESQTPRGCRMSVASLDSDYLTHSSIHVPLEHAWCNSVWDMAFFIGTRVLSTGSSISVAMCLVINLWLLSAFISECKSSLIIPDFDDKSQHDFYLWRTQVAHDIRFRSFTGESLASGVCREKLYLPVGNRQLSMALLLREYLEPIPGLGTTELTSGMWLCILALCVWFLTLTVEVRSIVDAVSAYWNIPFEPETRFLPDSEDRSKMRIVSTSRPRRYFVLMISVLRLTVVIFLGYYGTLFLVHEVDIKDIILNCVALEIILNFDELLFAALVPKMPQATLGQIMPLEYRRRRKAWNTWGFFTMQVLVLPAVFVAIHSISLKPFVQVLKDNLHALCGGDPSTYDFVVAVDAIGIPWAATTSSSSSTSETYAQRMIAEIQNEKCPPPVSPSQPNYRNNTGHFMQVHSADSLEILSLSLPEFQYPKDWEVVSDKYFLEPIGWTGEDQVLSIKDFGDEPGTVYNYYLQYLLGVSGNVTCAQVPFERCTTQGSTEQAVVMRQLCANKCGCGSPTTGTVGNPNLRNWRLGFGGCARRNFRKQQFVDTLEGLTCVDTTNFDAFASWAMGLGNAPSKTGGLLRDQLLSVFNHSGCPQVVQVDMGDGDYSRICEETSLQALCPQSCGCDPKAEGHPMHSVLHDFCPYSCNRTQPPCITVRLNHTVLTGTRGPRVGYPCVFPFKYKGVTYNKCSEVDWANPWCAVILDSEGNSAIWGDCPDDCRPSA